MSHKKYAPRRCQDGAAREPQRAAAAAEPVPAPAPDSNGPPLVGTEASAGETQKISVEEGRPRWEGTAPGPARLLVLEDVTSGEYTDGEVSETLQWAGRRRRSWGEGRRGDGEDAAGTARGLLLLLLAEAAGAAGRAGAAAGASGAAHAPADNGARSRQSMPAGREHQPKRRRTSSANADADVPVPAPAPAPVGTKQPKRLGLGFAAGAYTRPLLSST